MRERHVGRSGEALGLTQPAVSHALSRLRQLLGDPLFIRHAGGVRPDAARRSAERANHARTDGRCAPHWSRPAPSIPATRFAPFRSGARTIRTWY
ncbi:helix-turn-helix domain-containing protein [Rhizobium pisi]|nr:LysR family transcriptional regulator [Rhizobium pisi]